MRNLKSLSGTVAITLALGTASQAQTFLTNGLIAYYPFTGNADDASGSGNHCIVSGAQLATSRFGEPVNSYKFAGYPQCVQTSGSAGFPTGMNDFSVSLWVALRFLTNDYQIVFCNATVNDLQLTVNPSGNGTTAAMDFFTGGDYGSPDLHTEDVSWVPNQWYNLQIVRSLNVVSIYRNGVVIGQTTVASGVTAPSESRYLRFGLGVPPQIHQLYGQLDDIRIYYRALSASEVQQLYAIESGPRVDLLKAVRPSFHNLTLTTNYQLQVSADMTTWTNSGIPFTATNTSTTYPQYWDVDNWNQLYLRLQVVP